MWTSAALAALAAAGLARGLSVRVGGLDGTSSSPVSPLHQAVLFDNELTVPGESPLLYCDRPGDDWIVHIDSVDLLPNPPEAGQTLVVKAVGTVRQKIEEGAYVNLMVKYNYIRLVNMRVDMCEQMANVNLSCPVEAGTITVVKSVDLPREIPPGKYNVLADVFTKDNKRITCLTATVQFGPHRGSLGGLFNMDL